MKQKYIPEYLEEVCEKLDLILDAIYGKEADEQIKIEEAEKANANNSKVNQIQEGEKPKERKGRPKTAKA